MALLSCLLVAIAPWEWCLWVSIYFCALMPMSDGDCCELDSMRWMLCLAMLKRFRNLIGAWIFDQYGDDAPWLLSYSATLSACLVVEERGKSLLDKEKVDLESVPS